MSVRLVKIKIEDIDQIFKKEIDQFIIRNEGLVFHETMFNEILSEFIKSHLYYYFIYKSNILMALCPFHKRKRGLLSEYDSGLLNFEIPYGGWVHLKDLKIDLLLSLIKPVFLEKYNYFTNIDIDNTFANIQALKYWTAIINLQKKIEDIWKNTLDSQRRNKIRKAQKNNILISQHGIEAIDKFYSLLKDMNKKTGMISKNKEFYKKILKKYSPNKASIFLATHNNEVLAGVFLFGNKNVMHYWQGASVLNSGNFGQGELLQWEAIKWCVQNEMKYYDLCYLFSQKQLDEKAEKQLRIAQFKLGFAKELVPFYYYTKKTFSFRVINRIQNVLFNQKN